jgi:K+/H+ antiporter YhaU regulatory subunit KhtT
VYTACNNVKDILSSLPRFVERLEQKRKMHEGCAQVVTTIEELETQQKLILGRCTENSSLMEEMKQNMDENLEVSKANLELLKAK